MTQQEVGRHEVEGLPCGKVTRSWLLLPTAWHSSRQLVLTQPPILQFWKLLTSGLELVTVSSYLLSPGCCPLLMISLRPVPYF